MRRDPTQFRERFKRWKLGIPVYKNGKAVEDEDYELADDVPNYKNGKDVNLAWYNADTDTYEAKRSPFSITVTGTRKKKPSYKWVSPRTPQLTASDAAKAWDTMVTPALSWALPNVFRGVDAAQKGDAVVVGKEVLKAAGLKIAGAVAANPSLAAPGSAFWLNPITKLVAAGTAASEGVNLMTNVITPYSSWGGGVGDLTRQVTGWNPNTWTPLGLPMGQFITEGTNPGWYINPSAVLGVVGKAGNILEGTLNKAANALGFFVPKPNSFTRGIGDEAGLRDLIESGLVRGNPVGTEVSAKLFSKLYRNNRHNFRDIMNDTGRDGIALRFYNRSLTEDDFVSIKEAAKKYKSETAQSDMMNGIRLLRSDVDPLHDYPTYSDYRAQLLIDKNTFGNVTSLDEGGQPLAYFYDDNRNPLTAGYDYASSRYGVRINNADSYKPRIFLGHKHYSMPKAVSLNDPNVEVFKKGLFGITRRMNKSKLLSQKSSSVPDGITKESILRDLGEAKRYKESEGYRRLVNSFLEETGDASISPDVFYNGRHSSIPDIILENRPENDLGGYSSSKNKISIDPSLASADVPFHEGLHWQRIARPYINRGPEYEAWAKAFDENAPKEVQDRLFHEYYNSDIGIRSIEQDRAILAVYKQKVKDAVYPDTYAESEMWKPEELAAHAFGVGKSLGLKPFQKYPGLGKAREYIDKAREKDSYLYSVMGRNEKEVENFWKLLTGNYIPITTGAIVAGKTMSNK